MLHSRLPLEQARLRLKQRLLVTSWNKPHDRPALAGGVYRDRFKASVTRSPHRTSRRIFHGRLVAEAAGTTIEGHLKRNWLANPGVGSFLLTFLTGLLWVAAAVAGVWQAGAVLFAVALALGLANFWLARLWTDSKPFENDRDDLTMLLARMLEATEDQA